MSNQFLMIARGVEGTPPKEIQGIAKAESFRVWEHYKTGRIRAFYYFTSRKGAVAMLEAETYDEALAIAHSFPMAEAGFITIEVIELSPYIGFERLFTTEI